MSSKQKTFVIPNDIQLSYPDGEELTVLTSETLRFPFRHKAVKNTNVQLIQVASNGTYIENVFDKVKLSQNPKNKFGVNYLEITGLQEGEYRLWLKKEGYRVSISVHRGDYWNRS